jgi:hypothetical protein
MPKNLNVYPEFNKGELHFTSNPLFQYKGSLREELGKRYSREDGVFHFKLMLLVRHFEQLIVDMKSGKFAPLRA